MSDLSQEIFTDEAWTSLPDELESELNAILTFWEIRMADFKKGGFYGQMDGLNRIQPSAPRGSVLHSRILWTFSAAYRHTKNPRHLSMATHAFQYITRHLMDHQFGGLFWSVDADGGVQEGRKQVYAQAFGIYAMSEYYRASRAPEALQIALEWYRLIEKHSRDRIQGGYIEAFARDWSYLSDKRLSPKDENASKSMNTHLHVLEAYANLYETSPEKELKETILSLLTLFDEKIIQKDHHLGLFFSDDWKREDALISYGHDIEAGWLLQSCAESVGEPAAVARTKRHAPNITNAAMEGLDTDGGLWYEFNKKDNTKISEKHWWPQAEALIGFCNAWQLTGQAVYKNALMNSWSFIRKYILDVKQGEWFWGIDDKNRPLINEDKAGIWKCPYHNSRACLELIKRLKTSAP